LPDAAGQGGSGIVVKSSPRSVSETVARLLHLLETKGLKMFAVIDQRAAAQEVGLTLRETTLVIFGSPAAGTPVMDAVPLVALDLPLKVLVWSDDAAGTQVGYTDPAVLAVRHGLSAEQAAAFVGIHAITDALVAA
jgi:uncharacterized protein (DUF302 family)